MVKYRHCDASLVLKITNDSEVRIVDLASSSIKMSSFSPFSVSSIALISFKMLKSWRN